MANFKCKNNHTTTILSFTTFYKDGQKIYKVKNEKIKCPICNEEVILEEEKGNYDIVYSQFSGLSPLEKQKILRKRSDDDAKKQKYVEQDREKCRYNA